MLGAALLALPSLAWAASGAHSHAHSAVNAAAPTSKQPAPTAVYDRTTWQGEARIEDPNQECTYYSYPPVNAIIGSYPAIWKTADLSAAGISADDKALFRALNATVPQIQPRGDRAGDFQGVVYDGNTDPDCWWTYTRCTTPKISSLPADVTKCDEPNTWGFTLDDGPNCSHNAYFDYLQSVNQKATLFYIGSNVLDWPLEAQRGLADGHEICSHTWSHPYMTSLTNEQVFAELYFSKKAIKEILGITVRCWRPPYGDVDDRIRYIAEALDMRTIVWNADTDDYNWITQGLPAIRKNYQSILNNQSAGAYDNSGAIVLTHEIDAGTMQLSQEFLPQIMKQFTGGVLPVAVCMNNTEPYVEQGSYVYPNYAQWASGTRSIQLAAPTAAPNSGRLILDTQGSVTISGATVSSAPPTQASAAQQQKATSVTGVQGAATTVAHSSASQAVAPLFAIVLGVLATGLAL
ncbi:chitin deacetylase, carbohydrate esterase family 4 protein [Rhodotorula toruloides]|uniref:chitin deacetylase n=1 Tax=Rhodotorula toruloides TaxID=5286 RepID=A0A511KCJ3_RHOTO|nr:chitin deacetylase, carbohydrate esterase family 4 protein [Rhodotorula toruloides]